MTELLVAVLLVAPIAGGLLAWRSRGRTVEVVAAAALGLAALAAFTLAASTLTGGTLRAFGGAVVIDALGAYLLALTAGVAVLAMMAAPRYVRRELADGSFRPRDEGRFYAFMLWFVASLVAVPLVDNLGLLWVAIEATTVVSAMLVGITRTPDAIEAAWKYLILGTVGVGFALLATLLAYASSVRVLGETSDALNWTRLVSIAPMLDPNLLRLAFLFALVGYGTKMGLVPFHTWLPDAHSQAPSPISALLSGVSLNAALYALVRFHLVAIGSLGPAFSSTLLIVFGLLTLAVALPFIVVQDDIKRLLAYSSVEHMGLLALGLGFGGPLALAGVSLHIGLHAFTKATAFLSAGELVQQAGSHRLARIRTVMPRAKVAGGAFGACLLLLGGLPPSGIFVTEFAIIVGGVVRGQVVAAAVGATLLALACAALGFHGSRLITTGATHEAPRRQVGWATAARLGLPLAAVALLGLWTPGPLASVLDAVRAVLGAVGA